MQNRCNTIDSFFSRVKIKFQYFELDAHSISLFRVILGISLLYNLIFIKWSYAVEFLGKDRLIPDAVMHKMNGNNSFSIFDFIHDNTFAYLYLIITIISALLYTIGYKTKYFSWVTLFCMWNILQATFSYCFESDFFTFQLLFWSCFLPLDNYFAVSKNEEPVKPAFSVAVVLLFQIVCICFVNALAKYGIAWEAGYAIHNILMDFWSTHLLADFIQGRPFIYKPLTFIIYYTGFIFPLLLMVPFLKSTFRYFAFVCLMLFHLVILFTYNESNYPITGIATAVLLLPSGFWGEYPNFKIDYVAKKYKRWMRYILVFFCLFSIYIIFIKNLIFCTNYTSAKDWKSIGIVKKGLKALDIPAPVKVSFFYQNWRIFAPNPRSKLGWISFETAKEDGYYYDLLTNQLIVDIPGIYWYPSGYESILLKNARNYIYSPEGDKYKTFLNYWIPYKLQKVNTNVNYKNVMFVDYVYLVGNQSKPTLPPVLKTSVPVDSIIHYKLFGI